MKPPTHQNSTQRRIKSHFGINFKQEFLPADVGHHDDRRQILKTPGRGPLLIDQGVLGALDEDAGRDDVGQGGPLLADEGSDLVKGAVDLGPDVAGIEAQPLLINGRGAGHLDQGDLGLPEERPPGEGGAITKGILLARVAQLPDRGRDSAGPATARRSRAPAAPVGHARP